MKSELGMETQVHTLGEYRSRPHTSNMNFAGVMLPQLMESYREYLKKLDDKEPPPERLAIEFYLKNSASAAIHQVLDKNQPLSKEANGLMDSYYKSLEDIGLRSFFYLLLICTRETRHAKANHHALNMKMAQLGTKAFWDTISGLDEMKAVKKLIDYPPNVPVQNFCEHLVKVFEGGPSVWSSSSYGGPKWAKVAKPLRDFVYGEITMEMLLDTVWTLAHNGGPIFNKGMLFGHHDDHQLTLILDVQRAGQMANLVSNKESDFVTNDHQFFVGAVRKVFPEFGYAKVDWEKVVQLGAVGYLAKAKVKEKAKVKVKPAVKPAWNDPNLFQVTPTEFVKKITRKEVHAS